MTKSRRTKPLAAEFTIGVFLVLGIPKGRVFGREIRISVGTARYFSSRLGLLPKIKTGNTGSVERYTVWWIRNRSGRFHQLRLVGLSPVIYDRCVGLGDFWSINNIAPSTLKTDLPRLKNSGKHLTIAGWKTKSQHFFELMYIYLYIYISYDFNGGFSVFQFSSQLYVSLGVCKLPGRTTPRALWIWRIKSRSFWTKPCRCRPNTRWFSSWGLINHWNKPI